MDKLLIMWIAIVILAFLAGIIVGLIIARKQIKRHQEQRRKYKIKNGGYNEGNRNIPGT